MSGEFRITFVPGECGVRRAGVSGEWVMLNQHYVDIWIYAVSGDFQDLKLLETRAGGEHLGMCLSAAWRLHGLWPRRTFAAPNRVSVWD